MLRGECARCRAAHPTDMPREVRLVVEPGKDDGLGGPVVGEQQSAGSPTPANVGLFAAMPWGSTGSRSRAIPS